MIRPFAAADAEAVDGICLRTAEAGGDATGLYVTDELMPDIFARPYLAFQPDLALVVDDGGVGGYVLGVADTRAFVDWYSREWVPRLAQRYEHVEPWTTKNELIAHLGFTPERMLIPELDEYPAHLHIDLLARLQGRGLGRELIASLCSELRALGVPGVHLGLDAANTAAQAFYDRIGFVELASSTEQAPLLGLRL